MQWGYTGDCKLTFLATVASANQGMAERGTNDENSSKLCGRFALYLCFALI